MTEIDNATQTEVAEDAVRSAFQAIVGSTVFTGSERLIGFLRYVVDETLEGRSDRLKEYSIALAVFGQSESFDPQTNTIVRVQAGRLRRRLDMYYLTDGSGDPVAISIPKGGYVPRFQQRHAAPTARARKESAPEPEQKAKSAEARAAETASPSIAVLPFENYSTDPEDRFFADGLTEEIIANLARFKDLFVFSRLTTSKLAQDGADIRQLRDELGVDFVLEGSVRKSGAAVRVRVQLIDAASDGHVFSESFDRPCTPEEVFEIQDEIAMLVAGRVADRYGPLGRYAARAYRSGQPKDWNTYQWILRFYEYYGSADPQTHSDLRDGLAQALERDPESSDAWAAQAIILLDEFRFHLNERPSYPALDDALQHALRATSVDPENAFAYQALAMVYFHNREFADFDVAAERAITLNPGHADVLADMGHCYCLRENWDRGMALIRRAIQLSPVHPGWYHMAPSIHHLLNGDMAAATAEIRKAQMPGFFWYHAVAAAIYAEAGDRERSAAEVEDLLEVFPEFSENAQRELRIWKFQDELAAKLVEGWRKAGLDIG